MIAHDHLKRERAYELWRSGTKKSVISRELNVDYDTLLGWTKRFATEGFLGTALRYGRCGRPSSKGSPVYQRAIALRKQNPSWGAEYIHLHLTREFPDEKIVQPNQIRKWLRQEGLLVGKTKLPATTKDWATKPLECVQVDAKERLKTADDKDCCYLNFTDERTGAALDAFVFPLCPDQPGPG